MSLSLRSEWRSFSGGLISEVRQHAGAQKLFLTLTVNPVNSTVDDTITVSIFPSIGLELCQSLVPSSYEYSYYGTEYSYEYPSGGSGGTGGSGGYSGGSGQYYT